MFLILNSFILSFSVALRMIVPVILISIASVLVGFVANIVTLGMAGIIIGPATTIFISLFGMRVALALKGDLRRTDYKMLALYSVIFALLTTVMVTGLAFLVDAIAVIFTLWKLGEPLSFSALKDVVGSGNAAFVFLAVGSKLIIAAIVLTGAYAAMAVPLASAARGAGVGAPSRGLFHGLGRSFLPLFCVFLASILPIVVFELLTFFYNFVPLVLSIISLVLTGSLPDFDLEFLLKGVGSAAGLLWLNAWIWSASALALLKFDGTDAPRAPAPEKTAEPAPDIRALRKSRERSF